MAGGATDLDQVPNAGRAAESGLNPAAEALGFKGRFRCRGVRTKPAESSKPAGRITRARRQSGCRNRWIWQATQWRGGPARV